MVGEALEEAVEVGVEVQKEAVEEEGKVEGCTRRGLWSLTAEQRAEGGAETTAGTLPPDHNHNDRERNQRDPHRPSSSAEDQARNSRTPTSLTALVSPHQDASLVVNDLPPKKDQEGTPFRESHTKDTSLRKISPAAGVLPADPRGAAPAPSSTPHGWLDSRLDFLV